jgi:O-antigen ligase
MELSIKKRLFYFLPVLFCFCLPFGSLLLSAMIVLWGVISFFNIEKEAFKAGLRDKNLWLSWFFLFITCLAAPFSDNKTEALFSIEIKLSFLALPYYFFCFTWPPQVLKRCMVSFVSGCFFACMFLIARASFYSFNGQPEFFFYTLFSHLIHASYFAMYLVLAICVVFLCYGKWFSEQKQVIRLSVFFVMVFIVTIFLCASKMGIISLFITVPVLIIYKWRTMFNLKKSIVLVAGVVLLGFFAVKFFPEPFERLTSITSFSPEKIDKTSSESTAVRFLIWEQCLQLIKEHFVFGATPGDANGELYKAYELNGLTGALSHKLNAHNQFFQTFLGLGILGFALLCALTFGQLVKGMVQKNIFLFVFSLIIILNFCVESMLQRSDGTLFFVFFLCLFNYPRFKDDVIA